MAPLIRIVVLALLLAPGMVWAGNQPNAEGTVPYAP
jgi:hypothetical protein